MNDPCTSTAPPPQFKMAATRLLPTVLQLLRKDVDSPGLSVGLPSSQVAVHEASNIPDVGASINSNDGGPLSCLESASDWFAKYGSFSPLTTASSSAEAGKVRERA
jgi:hypothetical protein